MRHLLNTYIQFQGKLNRSQFLGAFVFYILLSFIITCAGFFLYHAIEGAFVCPETSIDIRLEPNGPKVATLITTDCQKPTFHKEAISLSVIEKVIGFCLNLLLTFAYMYPLFCLYAKRFQDIGFHPMIPITLIMTTEIIDQLLFTLINTKSGLSVAMMIIILTSCLFLPTSFHKSAFSGKMI